MRIYVLHAAMVFIWSVPFKIQSEPIFYGWGEHSKRVRVTKREREGGEKSGLEFIS